MIHSLPYFPLKWRAYEFFPGGHPRRSGVTLSSVFLIGKFIGNGHQFNLVPRALRLLGQQVVAERDSGVMGKK